jgi:hypothetical protein
VNRITWLVVAAVAGLGLVATVDAVRDEGDPPPAPPKRQESGPDVSEAERVAVMLLRDQAIRGTIAYLDGGCELHTVHLPDLDERPNLAPAFVVSTPDESSCRLSASRGAPFVVGPGVPAPRGDLGAQCDDGRVTVATSLGNFVADVPGCAPAWKPDGVLTIIRNGELVEVEVEITQTPNDSAVGSEVVLSRADLRNALSRDPWGLKDPVLREAAWLDDDLVAVVARDRGRSDHVFVLFRGKELVGGPSFPYPRLVDLRVSPYGSYVSARFAGGQGLIMLDERGDLVSLGIRAAHAVAWSPDEIWTALATDDGVFVFPTGERAIQLVRVPIIARDLIWR